MVIDRARWVMNHPSQPLLPIAGEEPPTFFPRQRERNTTLQLLYSLRSHHSFSLQRAGRKGPPETNKKVSSCTELCPLCGTPIDSTGPPNAEPLANLDVCESSTAKHGSTILVSGLGLVYNELPNKYHCLKL